MTAATVQKVFYCDIVYNFVFYVKNAPKLILSFYQSLGIL